MITAIILAGGKSSRMGYDKALIEIEGVTLIKRQLKLLKRFFKEIIIVTNSPQKYRLRGVKLIKDIIRGKGPLGGIYSGLIASSSFYNFVFACDMPFINSGLIKYMVSLKDNFDAVVPKPKKGYEPLFAIYSKDCIPKIRAIMRTGNLKVLNLFKKIKIRELKKKELSRFRDPLSLFMNINTKEDLAIFYKNSRCP